MKRYSNSPEMINVAAAARKTLMGTAGVSTVVNVLGMTAPLFMLQVYDRVLASSSLPTLLSLCIVAFILFTSQASLELIRARIMLRLGECLSNLISQRVYTVIVGAPLRDRMRSDGLQPLRDLDNIRTFLSGYGPMAFFDMPWTPFYLAICFLFHFWIGVTALIGTIILMSLTICSDMLSRQSIRAFARYDSIRNGSIESARRNAEVVHAMGLMPALLQEWEEQNRSYLRASRLAGDTIATFGTISRSARTILQSAVLAVGAWLVIQQEVTAGVMIASSIVMGRALSPVDLAISNWKSYSLARQSWVRLNELLSASPGNDPPMPLPNPSKELRVEDLTVIPPGEQKPTVHFASFTVKAGSAVGVVGPSGAGKSTLIRALVGAWPPAAGSVRLDGARLGQWSSDNLGVHIGYLPQDVALFDGSIAENIARFQPGAKGEMVVAAAKAAGAHDMIVRFEAGYETQIGVAGAALSAGQRQRIGLARALYGDPFLVVLDEPNSNLDSEGEGAVTDAIMAVRNRGGIAVVVAHRPSAIAAVDLVLMLENGRIKAFGPRQAVLSQVLRAPTTHKERSLVNQAHGAVSDANDISKYNKDIAKIGG